VAPSSWLLLHDGNQPYSVAIENWPEAGIMDIVVANSGATRVGAGVEATCQRWTIAPGMARMASQSVT